MDKKDLIKILGEKMTNKAEHLRMHERAYMLSESYEYYLTKGEPLQNVMIAIEEMGELTQAISKVERGKMTPVDHNVVEEIADVKICMYDLNQNLLHSEAFSLNSVWENKCSCDKKSSIPHLTILRKMSKLTVQLVKLLEGKPIDYDKIAGLVFDVNVELFNLCEEYQIVTENVLYCEDAKMEYTQSRIKEGTL